MKRKAESDALNYGWIIIHTIALSTAVLEVCLIAPSHQKSKAQSIFRLGKLLYNNGYIAIMLHLNAFFSLSSVIITKITFLQSSIL